MGEFDIIHYGSTPVPWTVSWSAERDGRHFVATEPNYGMPAVFAPESRGRGKPLFARPHDQRLRRVMREQRCDLCGHRISIGRAKISMSREQSTDVGFLQTEPLLHRECAIMSLTHCPRLQHQLSDGTLRIRQVTVFKLATSFLTAAAVKEITGEDWPDGVVMGALKYQIERYIPRSVGWLIG